LVVKITARFSLLFGPALVALLAQSPKVETLSTDRLIREAGPTFRIDDNRIANHTRLIAYGDQRFTDPANTLQSTPRIPQWLVNRIAREHPAAVIMNGDVPRAGDVINDYAVFQAETKSWHDLNLLVLPYLRNHEFIGDSKQLGNPHPTRSAQNRTLASYPFLKLN
jgi:hypothetical protein